MWKIATYYAIWISVGVLYFFYLTKNTTACSVVSIAEPLINVLVLSSLSIGVWFIIKYSRFDEKNALRTVLIQAGNSLIITAIWIFVSWLIMLFIAQDKSHFNQLFLDTLLVKIALGTSLYFLTVFFYYIVIYYQNNKENIERKNELALMLQQQELNNLKAQINPHFLFNSLNSISYLIYTEPDEAHNSIVKLSEYFRYSLKIEKTIATVKEEVDNIKRYFDIEKTRFSNKMRVNYEIEEQCLSYKLPVMLLQPLAENAVKHGVYESTEMVQIDVIIKDDVDFYSILMRNSFDKNAIPRKGTGTGIKNIEKRLKLVYKRADLMIIKKEDSIFEVKLLIPKNIES